jgi:hypothetical protein
LHPTDIPTTHCCRSRSTAFAGHIRIDVRGNAVFPHIDRDGVCGYEIKNRNFTGFAPGGEKGLW